MHAHRVQLRAAGLMPDERPAAFRLGSRLFPKWASSAYQVHPPSLQAAGRSDRPIADVLASGLAPHSDPRESVAA
eukprot:13532331-Alexandrium_andersonii.AAC.1